MAAGHRSSPEGQQAFSKLCEKYWYPLYAHVRRQERDGLGAGSCRSVQVSTIFWGQAGRVIICDGCSRFALAAR